MKTYSFKFEGRTIKIEAEGFLEAEVAAKEKVFANAVRFIGAETEEGERWCESCESDSCPCPDPDGCHGERGHYSDGFDPYRGHTQTWTKCYECSED